MEKEYLLSWENIVKEGGEIFHSDLRPILLLLKKYFRCLYRIVTLHKTIKHLL